MFLSGVLISIPTVQSFWPVNEDFDRRGMLFADEFEPLEEEHFSPSELTWNMKGFNKQSTYEKGD